MGVMLMKIFKEIGFGIGSFISTEIELPSKEIRVRRWMSGGKIESVYVRIRIYRIEVIVDTKDLVKIRRKTGYRMVVGVRCR